MENFAIHRSSYVSLYGLKQTGRMWYQHISQYLLSHGFKSDDICPCIFIKHYLKEFVIIAIYVDDLNIIGTSNDIEDVVAMLSRQFEMKDLGLTIFCLGL